MIKIKTSLLIILLTIKYLVFSQNLFPNPNFEQYNTCPDAYSGINTEKCVAWHCIAGSPDYFNCSFYGQSGNPGAQPSSGKGVVGMWGLPNNLFCKGQIQRESISSALVLPIEKCKSYQLSFDISLDMAGSSSLPGYGSVCIDFGFYFYKGADPNSCINSCGCWGNIKPQISVSGDKIPIKSYATFIFKFLATDNFDKVAIGPYCSDVMLTSACYAPLDNFGPFAHYFNIDNLSLFKIEDSKTILRLSDSIICQNQSLRVSGISSDSISIWNWKIPGAIEKSVDSESAIFLFPNAGKYNISLSTQSICGNKSENFMNAIKVNPIFNKVDLDSSILTCSQKEYAIPHANEQLNYNWSDGINGYSRFFLKEGKYTVEATDNYGCHQSRDNILVNFISGLGFYSNPTNESWQSDYKINPSNKIKLFDNLGRNIFTENNIAEIDINAKDLHLPNGVYYLWIERAQCNTIVKLVYINKE